MKDSRTQLDVKSRAELKTLRLKELAQLILKDMATQKVRVPFGALPYLQAMGDLDHIDQVYGQDSGRSVVAYALSNLSTWRGPVARAIKHELNRRLKD